ncbi:MAG TPA: TetR/AcrR family transcriptional regulator [Herbaspirillum sp.]|jgi:AcrR family transcriptional regulator
MKTATQQTPAAGDPIKAPSGKSGKGKATTAAATPGLAAPRKKPGRPLSFDRELALEQAMLVFWQYGYDTTSLNDLTAAMGITPPSLYGAFGDKEKLFLEAVQRYTEKHEEKTARCLEQAPTAREAVHALLKSVAIEHTCPQHPPGCMMDTVVTNCTAESAHLQAMLAEMKERKIARFTARIQRGIDEGELPPGTSAQALSGFYCTVLNGMTPLARDHASCEQLQSVVAMAMNAWPTAPASPESSGSA